MVEVVHDDRFDKMFKELENDPEYLKELGRIEEDERRLNERRTKEEGGKK